MTWIIRINKKAKKQFQKLDKSVQIKIIQFVKKIEKSDNPRKYGAALKGKFYLFWKFRVGDYRLICDIEDAVLTIEVISMQHRKQVYK